VNWTFGAPTPVSAPSLSCSSTNGCFSVSFPGFPGNSYIIQATTNLSNPVWVSLVTTNAGVNGLVVFMDADSPNYPCRFYRSVSP
jgi:hypothetical protein